MPHDLNTGTAAWNKGRNDRWIPNKGMNSHTYMTFPLDFKTAL
ncbi:hypothetical protein CFU_0254 [Collimonas fungivorans Ter331]|uniref:Uncharacterized protein n=1 Tax=Collimonas fungivorans (strain Ter331) TaxID=1005048 RepID=G0A819_COLFT|nr:hypothetical protein CFU_0254 [Collimonas fungivorans Ter331]